MHEHHLVIDARGAVAARSRVEVRLVGFVFLQKLTRAIASIKGRFLVVPGFNAVAWWTCRYWYPIGTATS
jgi:hypothetical protein